MGDDMGSREQFDELARTVVEPVRRFLARRTDPDTAEDVLADVLLVCWRRLDQVPDEPLPWVYGVARNCLANAERGVRRRRRLSARLAAQRQPVESGSDADPLVRRTLDAMRPDDAELLRLWAWEGLPPAEIAVVLGVSPNAAAVRLHRARERFRQLWRKTVSTAGHEGVEGRNR